MSRSARSLLAGPVVGLVVGSVVGVAALGACSAHGDGAPEAAARTDPPAGFGARVTQYTHDVPKKLIAVQVSNGSDRPFTVESVEVRAPGFDGPGVVASGLVVEPSRIFDIRMGYGTPDCDVSSDSSPLEVAFTFAGHDGTAVVQPADGAELMRRLHDETCAAEAVQEAAPMVWASGWEVHGQGDRAKAVGTLRIGPVADGQEIALLGTVPSVLFQLAPRHVPERMSAGDVVEVPVEARPTRCDPHAMADNGAGWEFEFRVRLLTQHKDALVPLPPDDAARQQLQDYWLHRCGLAED